MRERPKKMTAFAEAPTQHLSTSDVDPVISYNVKMLLADRGYSQTALGEALGLKRSGVSLKLSGRTTWSGTDMVNAAHFLGVSLDVLVDDSLMRQMKELRGTQNEKNRGGKYPAAAVRRIGAPGGTRTHTVQILRLSPLPIGIQGLSHNLTRITRKIDFAKAAACSAFRAMGSMVNEIWSHNIC